MEGNPFIFFLHSFSTEIKSVVMLGDIYGVEPYVDPELAANDDLFEALRTSALTLASRNTSIERMQLPVSVAYCLNRASKMGLRFLIFQFQISFRGFPTNYDIDSSILFFNLENAYGKHPPIKIKLKNEEIVRPAVWFNINGREIEHTYSYSNT